MELEYLDGCLFIHCDVESFSASSLKTMKLVWGWIKESAFMQGYDHIYTYTKNLKFALMVDGSGKVIDEFNLDDEDYEVIKWDLK